MSAKVLFRNVARVIILICCHFCFKEAYPKNFLSAEAFSPWYLPAENLRKETSTRRKIKKSLLPTLQQGLGVE